MDRKWFRLWNFARLRAKVLEGLALGRTMLLLACGSLVFFLLLGAGGVAGQKLDNSPLPSMKGLAASLSAGFFKELLGMEVPHLPETKEPSALSGEKVTSFVFQMLTSVNPGDPKSLLSRELPGMAADDAVLLRSGSGGTPGAPADYHPGQDGLAGQTAQPQTTPQPQAGGGSEGDGTGGDNGEGAAAGSPVESAAPEPSSSADASNADQPNQQDQAGQDKRIMIYHSHPREAYNPLLGLQSDNPSSADPDKNVMLVGSYVAQRLEKRGIGTLHTEDDYATEVADYNWNYSYKYSRATVKAAMSEHAGMTELIDIHRDSQRYDKTTTVINGKSYAQVYFILGRANKDWKENEAFANSIHKLLEKKYPGLSRGIWGKSSGKGNNGEYNQTLSPTSVLIEVGGIDNTEAELKATAEVLGDAIADLYWSSHQAEKANAKTEDGGAGSGTAGAEGGTGEAN
ncbi:stage II sporulation protein P [Paenibacillus sp. HN-1]|uniref:stage II sporulation protein P n=1 Tax=Paenibacillus TaxID=44249 RepID=UPI001CA9A5CB|nr:MULTISPECIES: stage II sporulation protein P [Paenibacillus]MBY9079485.1 stage II sporulation protein P [Paenibacillus sp. CGMCC 1.18879]MBY9085574.1 stage II sporulation protein P [Paenibacillus sinensis]